MKLVNFAFNISRFLPHTYRTAPHADILASSCRWFKQVSNFPNAEDSNEITFETYLSNLDIYFLLLITNVIARNSEYNLQYRNQQQAAL